MGSFITKTYQLIAQKKWLAIFLLLATIISLVALISKIEFDDDISALIPASEEAKKTFKIFPIYN